MNREESFTTDVCFVLQRCYKVAVQSRSIVLGFDVLLHSRLSADATEAG